MDFHQFTRTVQKIVLYETKSVSFQSKIQIILDEFDHWIFQRLYIVGSNHAQTKFRIIKVDRTEPRDLLISDDKVIYDPIQIREVLNMIDVGKFKLLYQNKSMIFFLKKISSNCWNTQLEKADDASFWQIFKPIYF